MIATLLLATILTADQQTKPPCFEFATPIECIGPFEFAPLIDVEATMLKGTIELQRGGMVMPDPDRKCTSTEISECKQDCMDSHQQYSGCEVKTVAGRLTRICTCIDVSLRAALEVCE
jgi:hypothetical protein